MNAHAAMSSAMCGLVYEDHKTMPESMSGEFSYFRKFSCSETDAQAMFCYRERDNTVWVTFRGTDSARDALVNLKIVKRRYPGSDAKVHAGFLSQFTSVREDAMRYINGFPGRKRVVVSGHSLGGALACMFAVDIVRMGEARVVCNVFGCPKVGDVAFSRLARYYLAIRMFVYGDDPVTHLPCWPGWAHAGDTVHLPSRGAARTVCGIPIGDHDMARYIEAIESGVKPLSQNIMRSIRSGLVKATVSVCAIAGKKWISGSSPHGTKNEYITKNEGEHTNQQTTSI